MDRLSYLEPLEWGLFIFVSLGLIATLSVSVVMGWRNYREWKEERAIESRPPPELAILAFVRPAPATLEERLNTLGIVFADEEDLAKPGPELAGAVVAVKQHGGCDYCEDECESSIRLDELDEHGFRRHLVVFCVCGAFQVRTASESVVLGEWYEWHEDVFELFDALERNGPRVLRRIRYEILFTRRDELQSRVDRLTNALIGMENLAMRA